MVSFRHHLVTIVAIFLALAIGVALGAGPLRDGATNLLAGQNEELIAERDQLQSDLAAASGSLEGRDAVVQALAAERSADLLAGRVVAVLSLPGAEADDVAAAAASLTDAGAEIASQAAVTDAWAESDLSFRQSFAAQVAGYLTETVAADATPEFVLSAALAQVVTGGKDADLIGELLLAGDSPFVSAIPESGVQAVIVVGPREATELIDWAPVLGGFAATMHTVGMGDGLVLPARAAGSTASTLDSSEFMVPLLPLAVAAELAGMGGSWGVAEGSDAVLPPEPEFNETDEPADEASEQATDEATEEADDEETPSGEESDEG